MEKFKILSKDSRKYIVKEVGNRYALTTYRAKALSQAITQYTKFLSSLGISFPQTREVAVKKVNTHYEISLVEDYYEQVLNEQIKKVSRQKVASYLDNILYYIEIVSDNGYTVSIDPKPENFAIKNDDLVYIDACPPLINKQKFYWMLIRKDEQTATIAEKLDHYYNLEGQLAIFIYRTLLIEPKLKKIISNLIFNRNKLLEDGFNSSKLATLLTTSLFANKLKKDDKRILKLLVVSATQKDRDLLRITYLLLMVRKNVSNFYQKVVSFQMLTKDFRNIDKAKEETLALLD